MTIERQIVRSRFVDLEGSGDEGRSRSREKCSMDRQQKAAGWRKNMHASVYCLYSTKNSSEQATYKSPSGKNLTSHCLLPLLFITRSLASECSVICSQCIQSHQLGSSTLHCRCAGNGGKGGFSTREKKHARNERKTRKQGRTSVNSMYNAPFLAIQGSL